MLTNPGSQVSLKTFRDREETDMCAEYEVDPDAVHDALVDRILLEP